MEQVTVQINKLETEEWLSEGDDGREAELAEKYAAALASKMANRLHAEVTVELTDVSFGPKFPGVSHEDTDNVRDAYDASCDELVNDWSWCD